MTTYIADNETSHNNYGYIIIVNLKLFSLYNKNIGSQLAVHTLFDWSV